MEFSPNNVDEAVRSRYAKASQEMAPDLCCPVDYDPQYLAVIPQTVLDRDYGCGDPSRYLREGETVLDLGSGGGKICFIAAQVVGPKGRVIGVDINDDMLTLARDAAKTVGDKLGFHNVEFRQGKIEDLRLDRGKLGAYLADNPVRSEADLREFEAFTRDLSSHSPLVADNSIDVVVSNCVLNLVSADGKRDLFREIKRVLRPGGRAVISDIVADEEVPLAMQQDPELWSGCLSGAFTEVGFLDEFARAGFQGIHLLSRQVEPWQVVQGIEFRSVTVEAWRADDGPQRDCGDAVIYRGPFAAVRADDDREFRRGEAMAVSRQMFKALTQGAYAEHFEPLMGAAEARPFTAPVGATRTVAELRAARGAEVPAKAKKGCC